MSDEDISSTLAMESTFSVASPPPYPPGGQEVEEVLEKQLTIAAPCSRHASLQTLTVDAYLRRPATRANILALSAALASAVDEDRCLKCVLEDASKALTSCARDLRTAKKNSEWSKEEKRSLKKEGKGLVKGMKHDIKAVWKSKS